MFNLNFSRPREAGWRLCWGCGLLALVLSGCHSVRFYHDMDSLRPEPDRRIPATSMAWGLVPLEDPVELRQACPSGVSKLEVQQERGDAILQVATLGLVNRQTVRVWCRRRER